MAEEKPIGSIKLGIELDGTQFGNNLDEINRKIKIAESSMKANLKAFDGAGKSYDALGQKVKDLTTVMNGQDAKIKELNKRRDAAIDKYGEESDQAQKLAAQINNATAKYNGYSQQLQKTKKDLAYASTEVNSLTDEMKENERATNDEVKALKNAGDEAGAFEAKQKGLEKQLDLSKKAVSEQEKVVANLADEFGETAKETTDATNALEKLKRGTKITETQLDGLGNATDRASRDLDEFSRKTKNADRDTGRFGKAFGTFKSSFAFGAVAGIASSAIQAVTGSIIDLGKESITSLDSLKKFDSTMKFAGFKADDIEKAKKNIQDYANKTVYDLETVTNTSAQLAANGVKDFTGLTESAGNLNAVAGGNAETFKSLAMMLTQTVGAGKLTTENWNQLADAIPGASGKVQESLKKSGAFTGDFRDAMAKGQITAEEFTAAISDLGMTDAAKEAASSTDTFEGAMGNLKATVVGGISEIISGIGQGNITGLINNFTDGLSTFGGKVKETMDGAKQAFNAFFGSGEDKEKGQSFLSSFMSEKDIQGIEQTIGKVKKVFDNFMGTLKASFDVFKPLMMAVFEYLANTVYPMIKPIFDDIATTLSALFANIKTFWEAHGKQFIEAFKNFLQFIQPILKILVGIIRGFIDGVKNLVQGIVQAIQGVIKIFTGAFTGDFKLLFEGLKDLFFGSIKAIWGYMNSLFFGRILKGVGGFVKSIPSSIKGMWGSVKTFFTNGISGATKSVSGFVTSIPQKFGSMASNIGKSVTNLWTGIKSKFSSGISNIVTKMKNLPSTLAKGISNGASKVANAFKGMFDKAVSFIKKPINTVIGGANWVLSKFGAKKIKTWSYATGTGRGGHKGGNALVNDGNGAEMVVMPNGQSFIPKGRNVLIPNAPAGMHVLNANETAQAMGKSQPTFAYKSGTGFWESTKSFIGGMGKWAKEKVSDIWEFASNPSKLIEIALSKFVKLPDTTGFALDASKGLVGKAKDAMLGWLKNLFATNEGGGSFDGTTTNGVFSYLYKIAQDVVKKYSGMVITSGYRAGDPYYHGKHQAVDVAYPSSMNGSSKYFAPANYVFDKYKKQIAYVITQGKVRDRSGLSGSGSSGSWKGWADNDHYDHLHINGLLGAKDVKKGTGESVSGSGAERWRSLAAQALRMEGAYSPQNLAAIMRQIKSESGGNPNAINNWDINAKNGTPSKGLLQVIDPTFQSYKRKGYNNIWEPLDNILASIRYARSRYGSLTSAYRGVGYANGGFIDRQHLAMVGEGNLPEVVIPLSQQKRSRAMELLEKTKSRLGVKDQPIINNVGSDNSELASKFDVMIELMKQLLLKDSNMYLDGRQINKKMKEIDTKDKINSNRGRGIAFA